jgi:hypothetical protein
MTEKIEGLKNCTCRDMDCLPNRTYMSNIYNKSVEVLLCPVCGGQVETYDEKEEKI